MVQKHFLIEMSIIESMLFLLSLNKNTSISTLFRKRLPENGLLFTISGEKK